MTIPNCEGCQAFLYGPVHQKIDSTMYKEGSLSFEGSIRQVGIYSINVAGSKADLPQVKIYLPAEPLVIKTKFDSALYLKFYRLYYGLKEGSYLHKMQVTPTSAKQRELEYYLFLEDSVWNKSLLDKDLIDVKMMQAINSQNEALINRAADSARNFNSRKYTTGAVDVFMRRYPRSDIALDAMKTTIYSENARQFREHYQKMPDSLRQSMYGSMLRKELENYGQLPVVNN